MNGFDVAFGMLSRVADVLNATEISHAKKLVHSFEGNLESQLAPKVFGRGIELVTYAFGLRHEVIGSNSNRETE